MSNVDDDSSSSESDAIIELRKSSADTEKKSALKKIAGLLSPRGTSGSGSVKGSEASSRRAGKTPATSHADTKSRTEDSRYDSAASSVSESASLSRKEKSSRKGKEKKEKKMGLSKTVNVEPPPGSPGSSRAQRRKSLPRDLTVPLPSRPLDDSASGTDRSVDKKIKSEDHMRRIYQKSPGLLNEPSHTPQILSGAVPPRMGHKHLKFQSSSTASVYLASTIHAPDVSEIVQCMAVSLHSALVEYDHRVQAKRSYPDFAKIWNEQYNPIDQEVDLVHVPSLRRVQEFLSKIWTRSDLSAECGVMAMCYVDRLLALSGIYLLPSNYRRIVLATVILAAKIWEELAVWNVDFKKVFPLVTVDNLALMEKELLTVLQFTVTLKASVYAKYYYGLRSLSTKDPTHFPLKILDQKGLERLEERSRGLDRPRKHGPQPKQKPRIKRTMSADSYEARPKRIILS